MSAMEQPIELVSVPESASTRLMRDSIRPDDIPVSGTDIVAVYRNGSFAADPADIASRFPGIPVAWIDVIGNNAGGCGILDIENGDATPQTAAHWVAARHAVEGKPVLYVNRSNITAVYNVMAANGWKPGIHFRVWLATLDGTVSVPDMTGIVAVQARGSDRTGGNYDESVVYDATWHAPAKPPAAHSGIVVTDALEVVKVTSTDGGRTWSRVAS